MPYFSNFAAIKEDYEYETQTQQQFGNAEV